MSRTFRIPRPIGEAAQVLFITLVSFLLMGVLWGVIHPTAELVVATDGGADIAPGTEDASFRGFAYFVVLTALASIAVALWAFRTRMRGLLMMLWTALSVLWGTVAAWTVGVGVADKLHADPIPEDPRAGDVFHILETVNPSVGLVVAPALALIAYWISATFADPEDFED